MIMPRIMGVVNVTPDSFSDGGNFMDVKGAVDHALRMIDEGADVLDVGGESTRPGADPVSAVDECERVLPVIRGIRAVNATIPISIDTMKAHVARAAVEAGATIVNDVSAGRFDQSMLDVVASLAVPYIVMHMQGEPRTMQQDPTYHDVVAEVRQMLIERVTASHNAGIRDVYIDVGIGFGKTLEHNLALLANLQSFQNIGAGQVLGISRKRFLGMITGIERPADRDAATMIVHALLLRHNVAMIRVHNVQAASTMLRLAAAFDRASVRPVS
jgi:dihydropteroate synthase